MSRVGSRLALLALPAVVAFATPAPVVRADALPSSEDTLFSLTNQDRTSNGVSALGLSSTLRSVARDQPGSCGGQAINGRSRDMIERNYFDHHIPPCNQFVWQAFNIGAYTAAGENIGWNNYPPGGPSENQINQAFMSSNEHRVNILGDYNLLGIGAWAATSTWNGPYGPKDNVIMYTEVFSKSPSAPAPSAPTAPPAPPKPVTRATAPAPQPGATASTTDSAAPTPSSSPSPPPHGIEVVGADREVTQQSLLESIVEGVIRLFLDV